MANNKKENTTVVLRKVLRDDIGGFRYKYHLDNMDAALQLLYNIRDESKLEMKKNGI